MYIPRIITRHQFKTSIVYIPRILARHQFKTSIVYIPRILTRHQFKTSIVYIPRILARHQFKTSIVYIPRILARHQFKTAIVYIPRIITRHQFKTSIVYTPRIIARHQFKTSIVYIPRSTTTRRQFKTQVAGLQVRLIHRYNVKNQPSIYLSMHSYTCFGTCLYSVDTHRGKFLKSLLTISIVTYFIPRSHTSLETALAKTRESLRERKNK